MQVIPAYIVGGCIHIYWIHKLRKSYIVTCIESKETNYSIIQIIHCIDKQTVQIQPCWKDNFGTLKCKIINSISVFNLLNMESWGLQYISKENPLTNCTKSCRLGNNSTCT